MEERTGVFADVRTKQQTVQTEAKTLSETWRDNFIKFIDTLPAEERAKKNILALSEAKKNEFEQAYVDGVSVGGLQASITICQFSAPASIVGWATLSHHLVRLCAATYARADVIRTLCYRVTQ